MQLSRSRSSTRCGPSGISRHHRLPANWRRKRLAATKLGLRHGARAADEPALLLDEHYRCHPHIAEAASTLFYRGRWTVLTDTRGRRRWWPGGGGIDVEGMRGGGRPVDHGSTPWRPSGWRSSGRPAECAATGGVHRRGGTVRRPGPTDRECVISRCGLLDEDRFLSATVHSSRAANATSCSFH